MTRGKARVLVGTYPEAGFGHPPGQGEGVWSVQVDASEGTFGSAVHLVSVPAPSFIARHTAREYVYAISETSPGALHALSLDEPGRASTAHSGGDSPCHLLAHGRTLYVAHYAGGEIGVHPLTDTGDLQGSRPVQIVESGGREPSHAHCTAIAPGGTMLLVADLARDELRCHSVGDDGRLSLEWTRSALPRGTGPRHIAVGDDGLLHVTGEKAGTVVTMAWDADLASADVVGITVLQGDAPKLPAHVVRDGDAVQVSVRGSDELVSMHVDGLDLGRADHTPAHGSWPRHFALLDGLRIVAAQQSHRLTLVDGEGRMLDSVHIPSPACVVVDPFGEVSPTGVSSMMGSVPGAWFGNDG